MNPLFAILSAGYIFGIFYGADSSLVASIETFNPMSLLHIPLYALLTALLILAFWQGPVDTRFRLVLAAVLAGVVGFLDEVHQAFIPTRDASYTDVLLDLAGIFLVFIIFDRYPRLGAILHRKIRLPYPRGGGDISAKKGEGMKKVVSAAFFLMAALLWTYPAMAQVGEDYIVELEGRYWSTKLDSTIRVVQNGIGTDVQAVNDLGMPETKGFGEVRLQIKFLRKHKFNFSFIPMKWDGDKVVTRTIVFNGQTFTAGTQVQSKLDMNLFKGGYEWDFLSRDKGFLGATIDVMAVNFDVQLKSPVLGIDQKENRTVPIPMIGLIGRVYPIKWVNLTAKVSGISLGSYGYIVDAEASLTINPIKYVGISGGYRYFDSKAEYSDNIAKFKLDGPFAALDVRF